MGFELDIEGTKIALEPAAVYEALKTGYLRNPLTADVVEGFEPNVFMFFYRTAKLNRLLETHGKKQYE